MTFNLAELSIVNLTEHSIGWFLTYVLSDF